MRRRDLFAACFMAAALAFLGASTAHYRRTQHEAAQARSLITRQAALAADAAHRAEADALRLAGFADSHPLHPPAFWQARLQDAATRHQIVLNDWQVSERAPALLASQRLHLRFSAAHEGRLLDFLDDLRDTPASLVLLRDCEARRTAGGAGLAVTCTLDLPHGPPRTP